MSAKAALSAASILSTGLQLGGGDAPAGHITLAADSDGAPSSLKFLADDSANHSYSIYAVPTTGGGLIAGQLACYSSAPTGATNPVAPAFHIAPQSGSTPPIVAVDGQAYFGGGILPIATGTVTANGAEIITVTAAGVTPQSLILLRPVTPAGDNASQGLCYSVGSGSWQFRSFDTDATTYRWYALTMTV